MSQRAFSFNPEPTATALSFCPEPAVTSLATALVTLTPSPLAPG